METPNGERYGASAPYTPASGFQTGAQTPAELQVETPQTRLGQTVRNSLLTLEKRLDDLAQGTSSSWASRVARALQSRGAWVQHALREEWELRSNAVSGLDQMWVLLSPPQLGGPGFEDGDANRSGGGKRKQGQKAGFEFAPTCTAIYQFKGEEPIAYDDVKEALERQAETFPRYKSILTNLNRRFHGAVFELDPNWDVNRHIEVVDLPDGSTEVDLEAFIADFIGRPWDFEKPLWECVIVNNFVSHDTGGGSALITRGHHSLADGQGFVASQLLSTSFGPELRAKLEDGQKLLRDARRGRAKPSKLHRSLRPLDRYRHYTIVQILMLLAFWTVWFLTQLLELSGTLRQMVATSINFVLTSWRQQYLTSEYDGPRVSEKEFSVTEHFPLSEFKRMQKAFSGAKPGSWLDRAAKRGGVKNKTPYKHLTLNDILCTIVADVMAHEAYHQPPSREARRSISYWLKTASHYVLPSPISLFIPVSIRPLQRSTEMENWSTGSIAYLPNPLNFHGQLSDETNIPALYRALHRNSDALKVVKRGWIPAFFFYSVQLTGQVPWLYPAKTFEFWPIRPLMRLCVNICLTSFQAVLTNVPGPADPVQLAGREVSEWGAAPPQAGRNTLAIGVITYAGSVSITITADHVADSPSAGVARRMTEAISDRCAVYLRAANAILGDS